MINSYKKIALGTAQFGMNYGIANRTGKVENNDIKSILEIAYKNGINTLDTAKGYGESEKALGLYLKNKKSENWNIITKFGTCDNINQQYINSCQKMNIKPNMILAHSVDVFISTNFQKFAESMSEKYPFLKVGVSIYDEKDIQRALSSPFKPKIIQLPINILDTRLFHNGVISQLFDFGILIHARSVFLQGLFYLSSLEIKKYFNDLDPVIKKLKLIASKANITLAELSLLWLKSISELSLIIVGVDKSDQLIQHLNTLNKTVKADVFDEALSIRYTNEEILNPALWSKNFFNLK